MKSFVAFISFFVLAIFNVFGQNYLLDTSQNAYFVHGLIGQMDRQFYKQISVGYSINGRLDIAISGSHKNEGNSFSSFYTFSPSFSYLIIKQGKIPFSLGATAEYEYKAFPATNVIKHNTIRFGIPLYYQARISQNVSLIPGIFGRINLARYYLYDEIFDYSARENSKSYTFGIQNTVLLNRFSITPGVSYTNVKGTGYLLTVRLGLLLFKRNYIKPIY
jgi:hypothetical protein